MKHYYLLLLLLLSAVAKAQFIPTATSINFDTLSVTQQYIFLDTADTTHLWQVGAPHKAFFDTAYSKPNAIMTDTSKPYPPDAKSYFILKVPYYFLPNSTLGFWHKYQTDSSLSGGYVDYSIDSGATWQKVCPRGRCGNMYSLLPVWWAGITIPSDTLSNGEYVFTGASNGWTYSDIAFNCFLAEKPVRGAGSYSLWLRYTFMSDTAHSNKAGWMIDNMFFNSTGMGPCGGGVNNIHDALLDFSVEPNPVIDKAIVMLTYANNTGNIEADLYDIVGQKIRALPKSNSYMFGLDRTGLASGIYLVRVTDNTTHESYVRKVVLE